MLRLCFVISCLIFAVDTVAGLSIQRVNPVTIIQGNDDGWGSVYIRSLYEVLKEAGYQTAISAPANDESGTSSLNAPPEPLTSPGDYDLIPAGAPAMGPDPDDDHITYVNSYPVTGIKYGINTTAPALFGGPPKFVLSGINHGTNLGFGTLGSGTVGAANEAVSQGIPGIAFSAPGSQRPYTNVSVDDVAYTYSRVAVKILNTLVAAGAPYLPADVGLNVNFNNGTGCTPDSFVFVMSRIYMSLNPFRHDVQHCGRDRLPTEAVVGNGGPCRVSISGFQKNTKMDISADKQKVIRDKLAGILSCV